MEHRVPMGVGRLVLGVVVAACTLEGIAGASSRNAGSYLSSHSQQSQSSSSQHKSAKTHHVTVAEEEVPSPELTKAEEFIQKKNFAEAEPLLKRVVESDPANYVAWFDLGFTEIGRASCRERV